MDLLPLFRSHHSIGYSILTLEEIDKKFDPEKEIPDDRPISIFEIAKKYNLTDITLFERDCSGLVKARNNADKYNINLQYGIELKIQGLSNWYRMGVFLHSTEYYSKYCKLITVANTKESFKLEDLQDNWCEGFSLVIPFYDSFLYNNFLRLGHLDSPDFRGLNPTFFIEEHGLIFDNLLKRKVENYCKMNNYKMLNTHLICYFRDSDVDAILTYRLICNRKMYGNQSLQKPNVHAFSSPEFSFESYLNKINNL